jgi:hypothetical protein
MDSILTHFSETLFLRGGTGLNLALAAGESLTVCDEQGGQPCEIAVDAGAPFTALSSDQPAGSEFIYSAVQDCVVTVRAPGDAMQPDVQTPPTDLRLEISRMHKNSPAPLGALKAEYLIRAATASAYTVIIFMSSIWTASNAQIFWHSMQQRLRMVLIPRQHARSAAASIQGLVCTRNFSTIACSR